MGDGGLEKGMGKGNERENKKENFVCVIPILAGLVCAALSPLFHSLITCTNNVLFVLCQFKMASLTLVSRVLDDTLR